MKAVRIFEHGNHDVLIVDEIARPECNDNSALVEIKACSLNHLDIWVRNGLPGIPINLPLIMGSDAAGTITRCGKNIKDFKVGDDIVVQPGTFDLSNEKQTISKENYSPGYGIIGETSDGVQTEYVNLGQNNIYKKPEHLTYEEAASMQLVFMTSYQMIVKRAKLTCDEKILIYGGTSGVGAAAIQIAKDIGATVIATVGDRKKENFAYDVGADYVLRILSFKELS
jgi:NADPH:quinone reductase-like Zn-dependent oxidoreductase